MFKKILACIDGSERSIEAVRVAARLAKVHNASLSLLYVFQPPALKEPFPGASTFAVPLLVQYERDIKQAAIERTLPALQEIGSKYDLIEEVGDPVEVIPRVADNRGYDLIVLGTRNLGGNKVAELGSISHGVLCRAHCPTMVVR